MQIKTDGVVLKVQNYNDDDRLLTILTRASGVVYAFAGGAQKMRSRLANVCSPLCYADFQLFKNRDKYVLDSGEVKTLFYGLRGDLDSVAYATYFCELAMSMAPAEEPAENVLRLLLNTLHMLETKKKPPSVLKAIMELRIMSTGGYMPDLVACGGCGEHETGSYWFSPMDGNVLCEKCAKDVGGQGRLPLGPASFSAARHIVYSPLERLYSFTLAEGAAEELSRASEAYVLTQTDREYKTLDFLRSLR